jgi:hypothetical protein
MQLHARADVDFDLLLFPCPPLAQRRMAIAWLPFAASSVHCGLALECRLWATFCSRVLKEGVSVQDNIELKWTLAGD